MDRSLLAGPAQQSTLEHAVRIATLVIAMIAGVFSSFLFERLRPKGSDQIKIGSELRAVLQSSQFIAAVIVAPLVFNGIYVSVSQNPQGLADYILAYQNGFFGRQCSTVCDPSQLKSEDARGVKMAAKQAGVGKQDRPCLFSILSKS